MFLFLSSMASRNRIREYYERVAGLDKNLSFSKQIRKYTNKQDCETDCEPDCEPDCEQTDREQPDREQDHEQADDNCISAPIDGEISDPDIYTGIAFHNEYIKAAQTIAKEIVSLKERFPAIYEGIKLHVKYYIINNALKEALLARDKFYILYTCLIVKLLTDAGYTKAEITFNSREKSREIIFNEYYGIAHEKRDTLLLRACKAASLDVSDGNKQYAIDLFNLLVQFRNEDAEVMELIRRYTDLAHSMLIGYSLMAAAQ